MDAETKPKKDKYDYVMARVYDETNHFKLERELAQKKLKELRKSVDDDTDHFRLNRELAQRKLKELRKSVDDKLEAVSNKNISDDKS